MSNIAVDEAIKGQGVQALLFQRLVQRAQEMGPVRRVEITSLTADNKHAFLVNIARRLNLTVDDMTSSDIERLLFQDRARLQELLSDPNVVNEAILATPTFRSFGSLGFSTICAGSSRARIMGNYLSVAAHACRP